MIPCISSLALRLLSVDEDHRKLGFYSPYNGCIIHVLDNDPFSLASTGWLDDLSKARTRAWQRACPSMFYMR